MTKKEVPLSKNLLFIAERQGFEPWEQLPVHRMSSAARSNTPASFLIIATKKKKKNLVPYANGSLFFAVNGSIV